jgi:hypothetical protein
VLALFCLAWLQVAAMPCAMAGAAASSAPAGGPHCPYCPPGDTTPSANAHAGSCAYPHQAQADSRDPGALFVVLPVSGAQYTVSVDSRDVAAPVATARDPVPQVPLPVRYCRYLK